MKGPGLPLRNVPAAESRRSSTVLTTRHPLILGSTASDEQLRSFFGFLARMDGLYHRPWLRSVDHKFGDTAPGLLRQKLWVENPCRLAAPAPKVLRLRLRCPCPCHSIMWRLAQSERYSPVQYSSAVPYLGRYVHSDLEWQPGERDLDPYR